MAFEIEPGTKEGPTLSDWSGFIGPKLAGLEANNFEKVTLMLVTDVGDDSW